MLPIFLLLLLSIAMQVNTMEPEPKKAQVTIKVEKPKDDTRPPVVNPEWRAKVKAHNEKANEIDQYLPGMGYTKLHAWARAQGSHVGMNSSKKNRLSKSEGAICRGIPLIDRHGAFVDVCDVLGNTPVMYAVLAGNVNRAEALLEHKAGDGHNDLGLFACNLCAPEDEATKAVLKRYKIDEHTALEAEYDTRIAMVLNSEHIRALLPKERDVFLSLSVSYAGSERRFQECRLAYKRFLLKHDLISHVECKSAPLPEKK